MRPPETCPNCGADVPPDARACPGCGSDAQTGWSEDAETQGLDLPQEDFDYDEFVKREFAPPRPVPRGIPWYWWLVALALLVLFLARFLG